MTKNEVISCLPTKALQEAATASLKGYSHVVEHGYNLTASKSREGLWFIFEGEVFEESKWFITVSK